MTTAVAYKQQVKRAGDEHSLEVFSSGILVSLLFRSYGTSAGRRDKGGAVRRAKLVQVQHQVANGVCLPIYARRTDAITRRTHRTLALCH